jgi:hypothetical protein
MKLTLTAYPTSGRAMRIVPAPASRVWMNGTPESFANRCLPLRLANEAGWFLLNEEPIDIEWNGGAGLGDLLVVARDGGPARGASSHFGDGILTWQIPYLFRTSPGFNLLVRGPANWIKDGAFPLEGLVETDWSPAPFTMNWKITRPHLTIRFEAGDPICMIVPQRRRELQEFVPMIQSLDADPKLAAEYEQWSESRHRFLEVLNGPEAEWPQIGWQRHYYRGVTVDGKPAEDHQVRLRLAPFSKPE